MGMFDTIHCEYPLPDPRHQGLEFQTKDLESLMLHFTITADGRLLQHSWRKDQEPRREVEWPVHRDVSIYTSLENPAFELGREWVEYVVRFSHGRVESITPLAEMPKMPELVQDEWKFPTELFESLKARREARAAVEPVPIEAAGSRDETEAILLASMKRDGEALAALLARVSDHWGYEDPIYRFYHQSFKVFHLQHRTEEVVRHLEALIPGRPLNPWFRTLVERGAGKTFSNDDNARWLEATAPILETFFHARYFLDMAVRYRHLETPPNPLPSGYAALLCLFDLR